MAHGTKPYGRTQAEQTIFGIQDMRELAASLGSVRTFDGRGNIVWLDDFESGVGKWHLGGLIGAGGPHWNGNHGRNGGFCLELTTSAAPFQYAGAVHWAPFPVVSRHGWEISFTDAIDLTHIILALSLDDGVTAYTFAIQWDTVAGTLSYWDATGAFQVFAAGIGRWTAMECFLTAKLVVDFTNHTYHRFIFNETSYNLAGRLAMGGLAGPSPMEQLVIQSFSTGTDHVTNYWDDCIVTQNEP